MELDAAIARLPLLDARVSTARNRMAAVWEGREPDYLPLIIAGDVPRDILDGLQRYNLKEAYYDPSRMLCNQLPSVFCSAYSPGDSIPSVRADMGCGIFPTLLGAVNSVFADIRPWITGHITKALLAKMTPDDIDPYSGEFSRGLDYMAYFRDKLSGRAYVFTMDVQGPIDMAHQVYGDDFFTELYDDPPFVHHLLNLCTWALIKGIKACKQVNGESNDNAYHYNTIFASRGGVKTSEDTTTLISADHIEEYFAPYTNRLLTEFGGGWVHFCGSNPHLYQKCLEIPNVSGLNFGNPERFTPAKVLTDCQRTNKVYNGVLRYSDNPNAADFYRRIWNDLGCKKQSLILHGPKGKDPAAMVQLWRSLQERVGEDAG